MCVGVSMSLASPYHLFLYYHLIVLLMKERLEGFLGLAVCQPTPIAFSELPSSSTQASANPESGNINKHIRLCSVYLWHSNRKDEKCDCH